MTKIERTRQLNRRKEIATGVIVLAMGCTALGFCCKAPCSVEVVIDEQDIERPTAIEIEESNVTPTPVIVDIEKKYTEEELEILAHLLWAEAGNQSDTALYYVASVVMNRIESNRYPNNLKDVVYQKGQYSPTWHGFMNRTPSERCYYIAEDVLQNGSVIDKDVLGQASKSIYRKYGKKLYARIGNMYFFTLK